MRRDWNALIDRLQRAGDGEIILQFYSDSLVRQSFEDREDELDRERSTREETTRRARKTDHGGRLEVA